MNTQPLYWQDNYNLCSTRVKHKWHNTHLVASLPHHLFSPCSPDRWYSDDPVKVRCLQGMTSSLQVVLNQLVLQVLENLGDHVDKVVFLAITCFDLLLSTHRLQMQNTVRKEYVTVSTLWIRISLIFPLLFHPQRSVLTLPDGLFCVMIVRVKVSVYIALSSLYPSLLPTFYVGCLCIHH